MVTIITLNMAEKLSKSAMTIIFMLWFFWMNLNGLRTLNSLIILTKDKFRPIENNRNMINIYLVLESGYSSSEKRTMKKSRMDQLSLK